MRLRKHRRVHAGHHTGRMGLGQVGVAFDHLQRLVAQHLRNLHQAGALHGQVRRRTMPEIVEAKVGNPGLTQGLVKRVAQIERRPAIGPGKEQRRIDATHTGQGVDRLQGQADKGQGPSSMLLT